MQNGEGEPGVRIAVLEVDRVGHLEAEASDHAQRDRVLLHEVQDHRIDPDDFNTPVDKPQMSILTNYLT